MSAVSDRVGFSEFSERRRCALDEVQGVGANCELVRFRVHVLSYHGAIRLRISRVVSIVSCNHLGS